MLSSPWPSIWPPLRPRPHLANPFSSHILPVPHSPSFGLATSITPQTLAAGPSAFPGCSHIPAPGLPAAPPPAQPGARPHLRRPFDQFPRKKSHLLLSIRKDCPAVATEGAGPFAILQTRLHVQPRQPSCSPPTSVKAPDFPTARPAPPRPLQRALSSRAHDLHRLHRPRNWRTLETRRQSRQPPPPPRPARQLHPRRPLPLQRPWHVQGRVPLPLPLLSALFDSSSLEGA
jgi:hypothetical protein